MVVLWLLIILTVLVVLHELGHFAVAKFFGVGVLVFSLGFGRKLFSKKFGETEYAVSAIPLGGYIALQGEADDETGATAADKTKIFCRKPLWQRALVFLAGPAVNFLLCIIFFAAAFAITGVPVQVSEPAVKIAQVIPDSPAARAGLRTGDRIIGVDGQPIENLKELITALAVSGNDEVNISFRRGDNLLTEIVRPEIQEERTEIGVIRRPIIGVVCVLPKVELQNGIGVCVKQAWRETFFGTRAIWRVLKQLVVRPEAASNNLGGPITIARASDAAYRHNGWSGILIFTALISLNLAIVNILPLPVLDGGQMALLLVEWIRGKPLSPKAQKIVLWMGVAIFLLLTAFALVIDFLRAIK